MKPVAWIALFVFPLTLAAGDSAFETLAQSIESTCHVQRTHIPFLGVARVAASPFGVHSLHLATFEDLDDAPAKLARLAPPGPEWSEVVRTASDSEITRIFARSEGKKIHMLLLTVDPSEATLIETAVNPRDFIDRLSRLDRLGSHRRDEPGRDSDGY